MTAPIPVWQLYGEDNPFPDVLHVERIVDRAAGQDWRISPHRHLHLHQLFLIRAGDIRLTVDGRNMDICPPMAVNMPRGAVHGFVFSAGTEGYVLTLAAEDFPDIFGPTAEAAPGMARAFSIAATTEISARFDGLFQFHSRRDRLRRTVLRAEGTALLAQVAAATDEILTPVRKDDVRITRFRTLVHNSLRERRAIESYAADLGLSARHLSRLCKTGTGLSAQALVEAEVVREACRLLVYTRMSVQSLAYDLGFEDPSYFSRMFQRNVGLSPRDYRARFEGDPAPQHTLKPATA